MRGRWIERGGVHWGWFVGGGCLLVLIGIAAMVFITILPAMKKMQQRTEPMKECSGHLTELQAGLVKYRAAHDGKYPPDIKSLSPNDVKDPGALYCPLDKEHKGYEYVAPPANAPAGFIVIRCNRHAFIGPQKMGLILQKDGQVMMETRTSTKNMRGSPDEEPSNGR